jgi:hypothetical protein
MTQTGQPKGILTKADIADAVTDGKDLDDLRIGELMTTRPTVVNPATSIRDAAQFMTRGHFRHLPVCDDSGQAEIVDITDICRALIDTDVLRAASPGVDSRDAPGKSPPKTRHDDDSAARACTPAGLRRALASRRLKGSSWNPISTTAIATAQ